MEAEDGAHEMGERVVAEVGGHIRDAEAFPARKRPGERVAQLRLAHAAGGERAVLRILLGDGQRQVSAERVGHRMEGLHRRQPPHLQVVAYLHHRNTCKPKDVRKTTKEDQRQTVRRTHTHLSLSALAQP